MSAAAWRAWYVTCGDVVGRCKKSQSAVSARGAGLQDQRDLRRRTAKVAALIIFKFDDDKNQ
jgi:hypothetical protein